jgi:hypothetical protein
VATWKTDVLGEMGPDDRPFTIGAPGFDFTQLPARDGVPHGGIQRSTKAPNCSYFTNWTSVNDRITWNTEVLSAGDYDVTLYYTCAAADVGSKFELRLGEAGIKGQITAAHDPPLRGAEHDRVPRKGESYVKDFRPLKLGTLHLNPGTGTLTLQATDIPGKQVMDFRLLMLERR